MKLAGGFCSRDMWEDRESRAAVEVVVIEEKGRITRGRCEDRLCELGAWRALDATSIADGWPGTASGGVSS